MKKVILCLMALLVVVGAEAKNEETDSDGPEIIGAMPAKKLNKLTRKEKKEGFKLLFNGENLDGWKGAENPKSFSVEDGLLKIKGPRGHLFYEGEVNGAKFKNFHLKAQIVTFPKANSGIFFHTKFQAHGWPKQGYEAQVNSTHKDHRKTGSIYASKDIGGAVSKDYQWFQYEIIVKDKTVTTKVDGKVVNEFTEKEGAKPPKHLSEGTIAIQAHDPNSVIHYRNIMIKVLE